ncbi:MAG: VWA domain-containing protein [Candidatus Hodarchaeota archaeon]
MAEINRAAVASNLQEAEGFEMIQQAAEKGSELAPEFFFLLRGVLTPYYKQLFKNLTKLVILKESRKVAGRGLKGHYKYRSRYIPYRTHLDIPGTVMNIIGKPLHYMTESDFVGVEKAQKRKAAVLILDTSGSMFGRQIFNAALTTAVLSYHMRDNEHSIVVFNTGADVMKKINKRENVDSLIDKILETQASGYTNITYALKLGLEEIKKARSNYKFAILITDGNANRGDMDELWKVASQLENLHVIAIPSESGQIKAGVRNCDKISKLGKGMLVKVGRFKDIPRALQTLLLKL